jgi:tetratricopeptide (TPR) repeat protein
LTFSGFAVDLSLLKKDIFGTLARTTAILWIAASAWPYGSATWNAYLWTSLGGIATFTTLTLAVLLRRNGLASSQNANKLFWAGSFLGILALLQATPLPHSPFAKLIPAISLQDRFTAPPLTSADDTAATNPTNLPSNPENASPKESPQNRIAIRNARTISVDPAHTLAATSGIGMAMLAFGLGYFFIGTSDKWSLIALIVIALNAGAMSAIGIIEDISPGKWQLLNIQKPTAFGSFVSRNSAATFLNIGLAACVGIVSLRDSEKSSSSDPKYRYPTPTLLSKARVRFEDFAAEISSGKIAILSVMVLIFVGIMVTLSRGGILSSVVALAMLAVVALVRVGRREGFVLVALVLAGAAGLLVWIDQVEPVTERLETISEGNAVEADLRWVVWRFAQTAFASVWLTGGGMGNFHYTYLPFQNEPSNTWFYHAESFYWQTLVDTGIMGGLLLAFTILTIGVVIKRLLSSRGDHSQNALALALTFLLTSVGLQSFVDFSLLLPGIFLPTCLIVGIGFAKADLFTKKKRSRSKRKSRLEKAKSRDEEATSSRKLSFIFPLVTLGLLLLGTYSTLPRAATESLFQSAKAWHFETDEGEEKLQQIVSRGDELLKKYPDDGELNMVMANVYTNQYRWIRYSTTPAGKPYWDNTLPLFLRAEYFDRSRRENLTVQSLLNNQATSLALANAWNCWNKAHRYLPLDWRPHRGLTELDFVNFDYQATELHVKSLTQLAFNQPKTLTAVGITALTFPGKDTAFLAFQKAMQADPNEAKTIFPIALMQFGNRIAEPGFLPNDAPTLIQLANNYERQSPDPAILESLWRNIGESLPLLPDTDRQKPLIAAEYYRRQGKVKEEIDSLKNAVRLNPTNAEIRFSYAQALVKGNQPALARDQINTCIRQRPDNKEFLLFRDNLLKTSPTNSASP